MKSCRPDGGSCPPRTESLKRSGDFVRLTDVGRRFANRTAAVRVSTNDSGRRRLGLSVSRKVGSAVVRNRLKRRFREIFRQEAPLMQSGLDLMIMARKMAAEATFAELRQSLKELFGRASLYVKEDD